MSASRPGFPASNRIDDAIVDTYVAIVEATTSLDISLAYPAGRPQLIPARVWTGRR